MAGLTTKKVMVRRFDRETVAGFVSTQTFVQPEGIELMRPDGTIAQLSYSEVQWVSFVRDFEEAAQPENKVFLTRPKMEGLWVRMTFRNREIMEGILANNLLLVEPFGFTITPPEPYSNHQRIFIPRQALEGIQVLGVVGSPLRTPKSKTKPPAAGQGNLFDAP